jgi:hypothetical protein
MTHLWLICPKCKTILSPDRYPKECACHNGAVMDASGVPRIWGTLLGVTVPDTDLRKALRDVLAGGGSVEMCVNVGEVAGAIQVPYELPF